MARLTLRPLAHPLNAAPGEISPRGAEVQAVERHKVRDRDAKWLAGVLSLDEAQARAILERGGLDEIRRAVAKLAPRLSERDQGRVIHRIQQCRFLAAYRQ
jgi:hypothetical protein